MIVVDAGFSLPLVWSSVSRSRWLKQAISRPSKHRLAGRLACPRLDSLAEIFEAASTPAEPLGMGLESLTRSRSRAFDGKNSHHRCLMQEMPQVTVAHQPMTLEGLE
jgi:hypothetical protein